MEKHTHTQKKKKKYFSVLVFSPSFERFFFAIQGISK